MKKILLLLIVVSFIGCKNNIKNDVKSINSSTRPDSELAQLILQKGDSSAYYELSMQYLDYGYERFLPFALIMANKYDYQQAYFDVFSCLTDIYHSDIAKIDDKTANLAIEYLLQANEKGHHQANEMVQEYDIDINKNSKQQIIKIFKE